jgi:hypothetical protein
MSDKTDRWTSGAFARRLVLLPALLVAVSVAFAGAASAQTTFQADGTSTQTKPAGPCSNGAFVCGTVNIAGYGAASWNFYVTSLTISQTSCGSTYTADTSFTLASDGSTLALHESGYICGPGNNANGYFKEAPQAYGHPSYPFGTWTVDTADSTGQFAGLGGSGTDALQAAGAHLAGSYTGTLGPEGCPIYAVTTSPLISAWFGSCMAWFEQPTRSQSSSLTHMYVRL